MQARRSAICLDLNAGRPLHTSAARAIQEWVGAAASANVTNPSSVHQAGRAAKLRMNRARQFVANSLALMEGKDPQLLMTSSCTEANQSVVFSFVSQSQDENRARPVFWITSEAEHECHLSLVARLSELPSQVVVRVLKMNALGQPDFDQLIEVLSEIREIGRAFGSFPKTLLSLLWVNNETGVALDADRLKSILQEFPEVLVHFDGAQVWGKLPIVFPSLNVDFLGLSGHKIGAPAGSGVLAFSERGYRVLEKSPLLPGKQEFGLRGGTENLLGVLALGAVAEQLTPEHLARREEQTREMQSEFEARLKSRIPDLQVTGEQGVRVSGTTHIVIPGVRGDMLAARLDLEGFLVSTGSACRSGATEPSHVLMAMGKSRQESLSCIRVSYDSNSVTLENLLQCADWIEKVSLQMRGGKV